MVSDSGAARREDSQSIEDALKKLFSSVNLFSGFPEDLIHSLKNATAWVRFEPEQTILTQGEINKNLYFLVLGTVDIFVDGGLVATLRRKGDLLGEMSVITNRPCSATIIAKTPVELLCVDTEEFKKITGGNTNQFDHVLYRIYSLILTDKLKLTNEKAKRLEQTASELQRAKNELQEINAQMERRVVERTQSLQTKLQNLLNEHLLHLRSSLADTAQKADVVLRKSLDTSLNEVEEVIHFLEPLVQRFKLEISMKSKHVLLAQGERKAQTIAKMALGGTGINIEIAALDTHPLHKLDAQSMDAILVDGSSFKIVEENKGNISADKFVYIATNTIKENLPLLLNLQQIPNIVFVQDEDRAGSIRSIMTAVTKICSHNIFGLEKYLNVGVEIKELPVTGSEERQNLNQKMREHFAKLGIRSSILDSASAVLEELLMNAIYDAPTDIHDQAIYNNLQRTTAVDLKAQEQGILRFATDGTLIALSIEDPFGSLQANTIVKYLDSCYGGREGELQQDKGGAGRGLHQIIENSEFVVFNIQPRRRTEVIAFFNVVPGKKEDHKPLLQYFIQS